MDVVGVHLVGGVIGTLLLGVFATATTTGGAEGLLYGGGLAQLGKVIDKAMGFRASEEQEHTGLDLTVHAETAYDHGVLGHGAPVTSSVSSSAPAAQKVEKQA